jgi:hypothetical protein
MFAVHPDDVNRGTPQPACRPRYRQGGCVAASRKILLCAEAVIADGQNHERAPHFRSKAPLKSKRKTERYLVAL